MERILVIDTNQGFTSDLERNLIIEEIEDVEITTLNSVDEALTSSEDEYDKILMPVSLLSDGVIDLNIPVITYGRSQEDLLEASRLNVPCYGIVNKSKDLLKCIQSGETINITKDDEEPKQEENKESQIPESAYTQNLFTSTSEQDSSGTEEVKKEETAPQSVESPAPQMPQMDPNMFATMMNSYMQMMMSQNTPQAEEFKKNMQNMGFPVQQPQQTADKPAAENNDNKEKTAKKDAKEDKKEPQKEETKEPAKNVADTTGIRAKTIKKQTELEEEKKKEVSQQAEEEYKKDIGTTKKKAKCITIYSAKGGVGKTTISCELATFLSLTSHGRNNFKVCIADFNIDFGDVLTTLSYNPEGANMTTWAEDIRERIKGGEDPDSINYPEARIMTWLQKNETDGLYALLAPLSNADSMDIDESEINVMLRNLINNCGFDFVICDTGNNTRDSSFIALEKADEVFLVLTQSVNTANCNNSMLKTCARVGFDMDKISLIINMVKPSKSVGVAPEELIAAFKNPNTKQPYKCIAQIRDNSDIENYGNLGKPLTYNSSHAFTKSIGEIVRYLTKEDTVLEVKQEKKGLFSMFKR